MCRRSRCSSTRRRLSWSAFRACALGGVLFAADIGLGFTAVRATTVADVALIGALAPVVIVLRVGATGCTSR